MSIALQSLKTLRLGLSNLSLPTTISTNTSTPFRHASTTAARSIASASALFTQPPHPNTHPTSPPRRSPPRTPHIQSQRAHHSIKTTTRTPPQSRHPLVSVLPSRSPWHAHLFSGRGYATAATEAAADSESKVEPPDYLSPAELDIFMKLKAELAPLRLEVQDISGGCGSMFGLDIVSARFAGMSVIKQHQLVNRVLKEEIKTWHGMQLKTKAP